MNDLEIVENKTSKPNQVNKVCSADVNMVWLWNHEFKWN